MVSDFRKNKLTNLNILCLQFLVVYSGQELVQSEEVMNKTGFYFNIFRIIFMFSGWIAQHIPAISSGCWSSFRFTDICCTV